MSGQEALCLARRLEALHLSFSLSRGLVRVPRPVVQPFVLPVLDRGRSRQRFQRHRRWKTGGRITSRLAIPQLASLSVIMTRGARHCFFSNLRSRRLAACVSRRLRTRMSRRHRAGCPTGCSTRLRSASSTSQMHRVWSSRMCCIGRPARAGAVPSGIPSHDRESRRTHVTGGAWFLTEVGARRGSLAAAPIPSGGCASRAAGLCTAPSQASNQARSGSPRRRRVLG